MGWTLRNVGGQDQVAYAATHGTSASFADATFPNNIAAGSLLVFWAWSEYINACTCVCGEGTAGDATMAVNNNGTVGFGGHYKLSAAGGGASCRVTITGGSSVQYIRMWVSEWVYTGGSAALDQVDTTAAVDFGLSAGAVNAGAMTPAINGELIVSAGWNGGDQNIPSIYDPGPLGWASYHTTQDGDGDALRAMYYVQPTAESITPAMTQQASFPHHFATMAFKLLGGGRPAWGYGPTVQHILHNPR